MCMTGTHILLVEDTPSIALYMKASLRRDGFTVDIAKTAREALELLAKSKASRFSYDVILADLCLPDCTDGSVVRNLSEIDECPPIFAMSAEGDAEIRLKAFNMGAEAFFEKPFDISMLKTSLSRKVDENERITAYNTNDLSGDMVFLRHSYREYLMKLSRKIEGDMPISVLKSCLHQLKGSATLYGFPLLSREAEKCSVVLKQGQGFLPQELLSSLETAITHLSVN